MQRYRDIDGDSPVTAYECGADFIRVEFRGQSVYLYTHAMPGVEHVNEMKRLAAARDGLATYISINVKDRYAAKER